MFCISRLVFLRFTSLDICTATNKNIRNMHAVPNNQIVDILHFSNKDHYQRDRFTLPMLITALHLSSTRRSSRVL